MHTSTAAIALLIVIIVILLWRTQPAPAPAPTPAPPAQSTGPADASPTVVYVADYDPWWRFNYVNFPTVVDSPVYVGGGYGPYRSHRHGWSHPHASPMHRRH